MTQETLQWSHGFAAMEICYIPWVYLILLCASMEPRLCSHGNQGAISLDRQYQDSFNGATALQPWKYLKELALKAGLKRFNGATALQPWKFSHLYNKAKEFRRLQWSHGFAAMEICNCSILVMAIPYSLQWSHGFAAMEIYPFAFRFGSTVASFNGATALQPWKFPHSL